MLKGVDKHENYHGKAVLLVLPSMRKIMAMGF
jgi:hypothetical protein